MNHHRANELLLSIGSNMSNVMFNLAQAKDSPDAKLFDELRRKWDAALSVYRRAAPTEPAVDRDAVAAIRSRLELTYRVCCSLAPKQSVGELLDSALKMPEWDRLAAPAAPAVPAAPLVTSERLAQFLRCAYPVSTEINLRGYNWCEAWLDEARTAALASPPSPSVDQAKRSILVRITANDEGYEDVHPDLMMEDAMRVNPYGWPQGFSFEVVDQAKRLVGGEVEGWISVDFMLPEPDVEVLIAGQEGVEVARYCEAEEDQVDQMGHDAGFWGYKFAACGRSFGAPDYIRPAQGQPKWWAHLPDTPDEDEAPDRASTGSATSTDTKESA